MAQIQSETESLLNNERLEQIVAKLLSIGLTLITRVVRFKQPISTVVCLDEVAVALAKGRSPSASEATTRANDPTIYQAVRPCQARCQLSR